MRALPRLLVRGVLHDGVDEEAQIHQIAEGVLRNGNSQFLLYSGDHGDEESESLS